MGLAMSSDEKKDSSKKLPKKADKDSIKEKPKLSKEKIKEKALKESTTRKTRGNSSKKIADSKAKDQDGLSEEEKREFDALPMTADDCKDENVTDSDSSEEYKLKPKNSADIKVQKFIRKLVEKLSDDSVSRSEGDTDYNYIRNHTDDPLSFLPKVVLDENDCSSDLYSEKEEEKLPLEDEDADESDKSDLSDKENTNKKTSKVKKSKTKKRKLSKKIKRNVKRIKTESSADSNKESSDISKGKNKLTERKEVEKDDSESDKNDSSNDR